MAPPPGGLSITLGRQLEQHGLRQAGYNIGHCYPGGNTAAWLDYASINVARFFASLRTWCPDALFHPGDIADVDAFDAAVTRLRADRIGSGFVDWDELIEGFRSDIYPNTNHYNLDHELTVLTGLGITPVMEAAEAAWNTDWTGLFQQFLKHYAFSYWCSAVHGVTRYNFINEPDHPSVAGDLVNQQIYIRGLQIASLAVHAAIDDVNDATGSRMQARVQAPVITHSSQNSGPFHMDADPDSDARDDEYGWGQISLLNRRTDYRGRTTDTPIFDIYDTHLYNKTADVYANEIEMIIDRFGRYEPDGARLPISYSEFNRHNTSAFEDADYTLDTPRVFTELAEIWPAAMTAGADQLICFKFDNTVRSNGIPYGTGNYLVSDAAPHHIVGTRKSAEANRLFHERFVASPTRRLIEVTVGSDGPVLHPGVQTAVVDADGQVTLWLPHSGASELVTAVDLRAIDGVAGRTVIIEEVSEASSGGVVGLAEVPRTQRLRLTQPPESVWRVTICPAGRRRTISPTSVASVQPQARTTPEVTVRRAPAGRSSVAYLGFDGGLKRTSMAVLDSHGQTDDGQPMTFRVYGLPGEPSPGQLSWDTAPHLDHDQLRIRTEDDAVLPLGLLTVDGTGGPARLDVSKIVRRSAGEQFVLIMIREQGLADDTADDGRTAQLDKVRLLTWD